MKITDGFLEHGFEQARRALVDIRGRAGLHLAPRTITKSLRARTLSRLKALEVIVRRLIVCLAAHLVVGPFRPPLPRPAGAALAVPEGVEDVTESFRALSPQYNFRLVPARCALATDWLAADAGKGRLAPVPGPLPAAPLIARLNALHAILQAPEAAAVRMARALQQMQAREEPRPLCLPQTGSYRLGAELGIVAAALPGLIAAALSGWPQPAPKKGRMDSS